MTRRFTDNGTDVISFPDIADLDGASNFSIACWIRFRSQASNRRAGIIGKHDNTADGWQWHLHDTAGTFAGLRFTILSGGFPEASTGVVFSDDTIYHIALAYNSAGDTNDDRVKMYVNGVSQTLSFDGAFNVALPTTTHPVVLGRGWDGQHPNIDIEHMAFWTRTLSPSDVDDLFALDSPLLHSTNLAFYARLDGSSPEVDEIAGNNSTAITGTSSVAALVTLDEGGGSFQAAWARNSNVVIQ